MFGDKPMFGQIELSIDDKNRIAIPESTNREISEELLLLYNKELKIYEIYGVKRFEERYKELENIILKSTTKQEKIFYEKWLLELSKSVLVSSKVDSDGTIMVEEVFGETKKLLCIGAYDRLIIEPVKNKK